MDDWVIRAAVPEDESCIAPLWLRSLCISRTAHDAGFTDARELNSDDSIAWWALNQPIVTALIRTAQVKVLCDPQRAQHEPGAPAILWGWVVAAGDIVYGLGVKNRIIGANMGRDVAEALLGARLLQPQMQVMELVDLSRLRMIPETWSRDERWWVAMRYLVESAIDRDEMVRRVVAHIVDPAREQWLPNSMRAA